jgi:hypothetical protein
MSALQVPVKGGECAERDGREERTMDASQRNWGARVRAVTFRGLLLVELENEVLRVGVLAGKGADIVEILWKPRDLDLAWQAPGGIRVPDRVEDFVQHYPGGWQEMFPNAGGPCRVGGASHTQHGDVHARPWQVTIVTDSPDEVIVRFTIEVRVVPCRIEKTIALRAGEASFRIEERVVNLAAEAFPVAWGHHITFGAPYLVPGMRIALPEGITVVPQAEAITPAPRRLAADTPFAWPVDPRTGTDFAVVPKAGTPSEMLFLTGFGDVAWYEITGAKRPTCRISWDGTRMPVLWYWMEFGQTRGYPWYGRVNTIGLEPCSGMPGGLANQVGAGTAMTLAPDDACAFWLECTIAD